jgi:hypothetical protein
MSGFENDEPILPVKSNGNYRQQFDLKGKVAVVTGGAGILGSHFCAGLAESGSRVAVIDIDGNAANKLAQELTEAYGVTVSGYSRILGELIFYIIMPQVRLIIWRLFLLHSKITKSASGVKLCP